MNEYSYNFLLVIITFKNILYVRFLPKISSHVFYGSITIILLLFNIGLYILLKLNYTLKYHLNVLV